MVELSLVSVLCNMHDPELVKFSHFSASGCVRYSNFQFCAITFISETQRDIVSRRFSYSPTVEIMSESITDLRRKRGNVRSSITRIRTRLRTLQEKEDKSDIPNHARQMSQRLDTLSSKFKEIHYSIVAQLESEDELTREQANLDETDDEVAQLLVEIEMLAQPPSISPDGDKERDGRILSRRLTRIERKLDNIGSTIEDEEGEIHM